MNRRYFFTAVAALVAFPQNLFTKPDHIPLLCYDQILLETPGITFCCYSEREFLASVKDWENAWAKAPDW